MPRPVRFNSFPISFPLFLSSDLWMCVYPPCMQCSRCLLVCCILNRLAPPENDTVVSEYHPWSVCAEVSHGSEEKGKDLITSTAWCLLQDCCLKLIHALKSRPNHSDIPHKRRLVKNLLSYSPPSRRSPGQRFSPGSCQRSVVPAGSPTGSLQRA